MEIYNNKKEWPELKRKISIGETILRLAREHHGEIPLTKLKTSLHRRIPWQCQNTQLRLILKEIGGEVTHQKKKGRGRIKTIVIIPTDWYSYET